jgi:hypothetical protein
MQRELTTIHVENISNRALADYPVQCGLPLSRGAVTEPGELALRLNDGALRRPQVQVTERWDDGSLRWAVLDWRMPVAANTAKSGPSCTAQSGGGGKAGSDASRVTILTGEASAPVDALKVEATETSFVIANGNQVVTIDRKAFSVFSSFTVGGKEMMSEGSDIILEDPNGKRFYASLCESLSSRVLVSGPERVVIELSGSHVAEDDTSCLDLRLRYTFRAGDPCVKLAYKFTNREDPELGVHLRTARIEIPTGLGRRTTKTIRQMSHGDNWWPRPVEIRENVELQSGSFSSEMAQSVYGSAQDGKVVIRNFDSLGEKVDEYPHYLRPGNARTDMSGGLRATYPHLVMAGPSASLLAWIPQMELHFPKAVRAERDLLAIDIWPDWAEPLRLNRGMSREHEVMIAFQPGQPGFDAMESIFLDHEVIGFGIFACGEAPVKVTIDPEYARSCKAFDLDRWLPYDEERYLMVETKLGSAGAKGAIGGRGELDLGDGVIRDCSGNNENDAILNAFRSYLRQGEPSFLTMAMVCARHNCHVDFIAHDSDPLRQGTMAAHCPNHSDGATYPSHMWVGGLLAAYCFSGDPDFEEVALAVGENMRRWQTDRPEIFYCDSRECGWPMLAYVQLWHHTQDHRWLDYAHEVFLRYREMMNESGEILHEIPHGMGTFKIGYGEFMTWRACFFYYEAAQDETARAEVKDFLVTCLSLPQIYRKSPASVVNGGWACNDLFPAFAAHALTGDERFLVENHPFLRYLMEQPRFHWGGVDMHYYLKALHDRGELDAFC